DEVIRLKPDYEMEFNAALNKLTLGWKASSTPDKKLANELSRWLKDDKNREYQDKIYFALAQNDLKAGNIAGAIENLSLSIRNSVSNPIQKAESYYTIANLYFEREDFTEAKYYFDSTLMVMPDTDERYTMVQNYARNLSEIASNLEIIELTDSLIRISELPERELRKLAQAIKKERELAAERDGNQASDNQRDNRVASLNQVSQAQGANAGGNIFFAYNDKALKKGSRDFERAWGNITLEDNWRRSDRGSISAIANDETEDSRSTTGPISNTEIEEIFADVPKSEAQLEAAHRRIEDALFDLGRLFRSELDDRENSIESLERLLTDYPSTEHALDAYYLLFVSHSELNQMSQAYRYRQMIEGDHADSEYAKYISNPSYLQNVQTDDEKLEAFYQDLYNVYSNGGYQQCLDRMKDARESFGTTHRLQSKFSLLTALCIGKLQGREPFVNALKETIAKYPDTEEEEKAKEMIRLLGIRFTESTQGIEEINPDAYFALEENDNLHLILVPLLNDSDLNEARIAISNYNTKYHKLDRLNLSTIVLDEDRTPLFVIRRFATRDKAMAYYNGVQKNLEEFIDDPTTFEIYAASQRNYRKVLQLKSIDLYREFFVKEYLSK
ncbi:MAG: tetratricopeptide repeat protein, partial [Saprospiraceae bacterium]|nr:tetratricopeptide repeat protein [Saprospiraceae bacterium]